MTPGTPPALEFRIAISPTASFFAQVRFFEAALRRLGGVYGNAALTVVVGDKCDIDAVIAQNRWSVGRPVRWLRVPDEVFDKHGIHGNADWRYFPEPLADVIVFSDADTILVRDIQPAVDVVSGDAPAVAGHMAHMPPTVALGRAGSVDETQFWPQVFAECGIPFPTQTFQYSMDPGGRFPMAPPYFNLGFFVLNRTALELFRRDVFRLVDAMKGRPYSYMRCQIACTVIPFRHGMKIAVLPAEFNAANDLAHYQINSLSPERIRVIHYLRHDEIDRSRILMPEHFPGFLSESLSNPVNRLLQQVAREVAGSLAA